MIEDYLNIEEGIVEVKWKGDCSVDEIFDYVTGLKKYKDRVSVLKIMTRLEDVRVRPELNIEILTAIGEEIKLVVAEYDKVVHAFIVKKARETAFSTLYEKLSITSNYYYKVFSTEEAGRVYLDRH